MTELFSKHDLRNVLENQVRALGERIDKYSNDEIMANDLNLLIENCYEEFRIDPIQIFDEDFSLRAVKQEKCTVQPSFSNNLSHPATVDSVMARFSYPFIGEKDLFFCRASTYSISGYPEVEISDSHIILSYNKPIFQINENELENLFINRRDSDIGSIKQGVEYANKDVKQFNNNLRSLVENLLVKRKEKVKKYFEVMKALEVPLAQTESSKKIIPLQKKIAPIKKRFEDEQSFCVSEENYSSILSIIKHTCSSFERTPRTYASFDEESFRDVLLSGLNSHFKGGANGESFRNHGKTDICIEASNRAAFVAECKMWKGAKSVHQAISQLDSYTTWRDCKTGLIFFSRNASFVNVLDSLAIALEEYSYMRGTKKVDNNEFKCDLVSEHHEGQLVEMRVMVFDLHQ